MTIRTINMEFVVYYCIYSTLRARRVLKTGPAVIRNLPRRSDHAHTRPSMDGPSRASGVLTICRCNLTPCRTTSRCVVTGKEAAAWDNLSEEFAQRSAVYRDQL
jgi:hypothetical protein